MTENLSKPVTGKSTHKLISSFLALVSLLGMAVTPALSQVTSTWTGGAGNWAPCPQDNGNALWNTCSQDYYPGKSDSNDTAIIQGGPVTLGQGNGIAIANLSVAAQQSVIVTPGYLEFTGSSIMNNGSIVIGIGNGIQIEAPATVTLSGGGTVTIGSSNFFSGSPGGGATLINQSTIRDRAHWARAIPRLLIKASSMPMLAAPLCPCSPPA